MANRQAAIQMHTGIEGAEVQDAIQTHKHLQGATEEMLYAKMSQRLLQQSIDENIWVWRTATPQFSLVKEVFQKNQAEKLNYWFILETNKHE